MNLYTLIDAHQRKCECKNSNTSEVIIIISLPNFCSSKLAQSVSQIVLKIIR